LSVTNCRSLSRIAVARVRHVHINPPIPVLHYQSIWINVKIDNHIQSNATHTDMEDHVVIKTTLFIVETYINHKGKKQLSNTQKNIYIPPLSYILAFSFYFSPNRSNLRHMNIPFISNELDQTRIYFCFVRVFVNNRGNGKGRY
jgi:hypothetical protein